MDLKTPLVLRFRTITLRIVWYSCYRPLLPRDLAKLEYLNLYGTAVTDAGLAELTNLHNLKTIYLWQTNVTAQGLNHLKKALPELDIVGGLSEQRLAELAKSNTESKDNVDGKH